MSTYYSADVHAAKLIAAGDSADAALTMASPDFREFVAAARSSGADQASCARNFLQHAIGRYQVDAEVLSKVHDSFIYGTIVIGFAWLVSALLYTFVVPTFVQQYAEMGYELPAPTQLVVSIGLPGATLVAIVAIITFWLLNRSITRMLVSRPVKEVFPLWYANVPLLKDAVMKSAIARLFFSTGSLVRSGVPADRAFAALMGSSDARLAGKLSTYLGVPMSESDLARADADTVEALAFASQFEASLKLKTLNVILYIGVSVFLGIGIGFFAISMYMPMFSMAAVGAG